MRKVSMLVILFFGCVVAENNSPPCPGLPEAEGMEITCMDPKNNSTVDCSSPSSVSRGTVAHYRCLKKTDEGAQKGNVLVCTCKGKWKGIPKFNTVADGCGATQLSLKLGSLTTTLEGKTIQDNVGAFGESDIDGSVDVNLDEGGETHQGQRQSALVAGKDENGTLSLSAMPTKENESSTEAGSSSSSMSANDTVASASTLEPNVNASASTEGSSSSPGLETSSSSPGENSTSTSSNDAMASSSQASESSTGISSSTETSVSSVSSDTNDSMNPGSSTEASTDQAASSSSAASSESSGGMSSTSDISTSPSSVSSPESASSASPAEEPKVATEGPGQVPEHLTTLLPVEENTIRHSKELNLENESNKTSTSVSVSESVSTSEQSVSSSTTEASSEGPGGDLKIVPPSAGENFTSTESSSSSSTNENSSSSTPETSSSTPASETSSSEGISSSSGSGSSTPSTNSVKNSNDFKMKALELHNALRQDHQAQPLKLNEMLSKIAQDWADQEVTKSSIRVSPGKRNYAENMYRVRGGAPLTAAAAVELAFKSWSASSKYFKFDHPKPTAFSQIVWNKTTDLGIGVAQHGSQSVVVATYYPRGNVVVVDKGSHADPAYYFKRNVFPCKDNMTTTAEASSSTTPSGEESSSSSSMAILSSSEAPMEVTSEAGASSMSESSSTQTVEKSSETSSTTERGMASEAAAGSSSVASDESSTPSSTATTEGEMKEGSSVASEVSTESSSAMLDTSSAPSSTAFSASSTEGGMVEGSSTASSVAGSSEGSTESSVAATTPTAVA